MTGTDKHKIAFRGLITNPGEAAITGDGAFRRFTNGVLTRPGLAQARRGIKLYARNESAAMNKLFEYESTILSHVGVGSTGQFKKLVAGAFTPIVGQVNPVSGSRVRCCIAGKNFYVANTVVKRLSGISGVPVAAGGLYAPGFDSSFTSLGAGSVLATAKGVAYRCLFGDTDAKEYLHLGEPSGRLMVINTSGATVDPTIRAIIPSTATTSHFIRFYRSAAVAIDATDGEYHADDNLMLAFEQQLKATDISAGYVEITDICPESLLGDTIYTAPLEEGISQANRAPPACVEIAAHGDRMWFANTVQPGEFFLRILAVGGTAGIQGGDSLRFAGLTNAFTLTAVRDFYVSLTRTGGNLVTGTTTEAHGFSTNDYVKIAAGSANFARSPTTSTAFQVTRIDDFNFTYAETGSNVTLANQIVHASTVTGAANGTYVVHTSTDWASVSARVERTALNLVTAFNKHTTNTELWAEYLGTDSGTPGEILFRGRTAATFTFVVQAGAGSKRSCFIPQLSPLDNSVSLTRATNVVTATAAANGFLVGEKVTIAPGGAGSGGSTFGSGPFTILTVSSTQFTYAETGADGTLAAQVAAITPQDIVEAEQEIKPNRLYFSKLGEFEATTRDGWLDVGSANSAIKVCLSQRGQLWVWKTTGIYRILGDGAVDSNGIPNFTVDPVDAAVELLATESVQLFNNRCWGWTSRGVVAVSENGIELMSGAITDDLIRANQTVIDNAAAIADAMLGTISVDNDAFATAYESEHSYILHIPAVYGLNGNPAYDGASLYSGGCPMAYVHNVESGSWAIWDWGGGSYGTYSKRCALMFSPDKRLYLGDGFNGSAGDGYVYQERKALDNTDYRDTTAHHDPVSLTRVGTVVTGTVAAIRFAVGDSIRITPGSANFSVGPHTVTAVTATTFTYTQSGAAVTLASQHAFLEKGVGITWAWILQYLGVAGMEKRWDELKFIFGQRETYFPSSFSNSQKAFYLALANETAAVSAFLVAAQETQISRIWIPADVGRGSRLLVTLTHDTIDEMFDLAGLVIKAEVLGGAPSR